MKSLINKLFDIFSSLKLTATLLIIILVYLALSTFVPQDSNAIKYISENDPILFSLLKLTGLINPYHNFYLVFWLYLFTLNLIACTINRLPILTEKLKRTTNKSYFDTDSMIKEDLTLKNTEDYFKRITQILKKGYTIEDRDGIKFIVLKKGIYSPLNFLLVHLSIIIIITGIAISALFGYEGYIRIPEGKRESFFYKEVMRGNYIKVPLGFDLTLNKFENITTPEGQSIDYISHITITDGEKNTERKIRVNEPLKYKDMLFVQSSYEMDMENINLKVEIAEQNGDDRIIEECTIGDTIEFKEKTFKILDFYEDVHGMGPALKIQVDNEIIFAFRERPNIQNKEIGFNVYLRDIEIPYASILKITHDRGTQVVFIGSIIFILSLLMIILNRLSTLVIRFGDVIEIFYSGRRPDSIIEKISSLKGKE